MVEKEEEYLVGFATITGIGPARVRLLQEYFGTLEKAWLAERSELAKIGLPREVLAELVRQRQELNLGEYIEALHKRGLLIITVLDSDYPERLRNIVDPPNTLFVKSNLTREKVVEMLDSRAIGVVGTRQMTSYGRQVTEKLTRGLVEAGLTIISGMAIGVDGVAHETALNNGGKTIGVLGAGVEIIYPRQHTDLYYRIIDRGGILLSEVAPERGVSRGLFPARNRIISGLSEGVLVTEGAIESGSLITARLALEQGREVFAVPGPVGSPTAEGTNYLLKEGAHLVTEVEDILTT